jgi:ribosomal protein S18 acetylase RimI-like enzyme
MIKNSTIDDIDDIFELYKIATEYQKSRYTIHWPEFDRSLIIMEIKEQRQWKLLIDNSMACIWATTFSDPLIWEEKNNDPSVYIHRITTHPSFRGENFVSEIVEWAKNYAKINGKKYIRLDTVGENQKLIEHYQRNGFNFLGLSKLKNTKGLPAHYNNAVVSLFELHVKK